LIIAEACLFIIAVEALVLRRRLVRLTKLRFRRLWLVWLALIDQVLVISILPDHPHPLLLVANFASYLAASLFVWSNRQIPGALVIGLGGACNVIAIAANDGKMPASETALRASGWTPPPGHFVNSGLVSHPKLGFLGDIFDAPRWFPGHTVFSAGDVVAVFGLALLVYFTCARAAEDGVQPESRNAMLSRGIPRSKESSFSGAGSAEAT
jgi:Family of unknown function (DUF5317)